MGSQAFNTARRASYDQRMRDVAVLQELAARFRSERPESGGAYEAGKLDGVNEALLDLVAGVVPTTPTGKNSHDAWHLTLAAKVRAEAERDTVVKERDEARAERDAARAALTKEVDEHNKTERLMSTDCAEWQRRAEKSEASLALAEACAEDGRAFIDDVRRALNAAPTTRAIDLLSTIDALRRSPIPPEVRRLVEAVQTFSLVYRYVLRTEREIDGWAEVDGALPGAIAALVAQPAPVAVLLTEQLDPAKNGLYRMEAELAPAAGEERACPFDEQTLGHWAIGVMTSSLHNDVEAHGRALAWLVREVAALRGRAS